MVNPVGAGGAATTASDVRGGAMVFPASVDGPRTALATCLALPNGRKYTSPFWKSVTFVSAGADEVAVNLDDKLLTSGSCPER